MSESSLGGRIRAARGDLSQKKVSSLLGVGIATIQRWENNGTSPSAESLLNLSNILGVNACWLLTGEGAAQQELLPDNQAEVDTDLLGQIIEGVEIYLNQENAELPAEKKAGLISLLYDRFRAEGKIEKNLLNRFIKLVA